jgi:hypothetical protein
MTEFCCNFFRCAVENTEVRWLSSEFVPSHSVSFSFNKSSWWVDIHFDFDFVFLFDWYCFMTGSAQVEHSGLQHTHRALSACVGITHRSNKENTVWAEDCASLAELRGKLWQGSDSYFVPDPELQEWHSISVWREQTVSEMELVSLLDL